MKKKLMLALSLVLLLTACSSASSEPTLRVGVEESYVEYYKMLADEFTADMDFKISVVAVSMFDVLDALPTQQGNSADVFMLPNDRIGDLVSQNLITPLNFDIKGYTQNATEAASYNGDNYMVPLSTDTTLLIYNKDLVDTMPTTLGEIEPKDIAAKFTDFYFAAGMFHTFGGYIFKDGNVSNIGLNTPESIKAGEAIQKYYASGVDHWSLMKDDTIAYDIAMNAFTEGDVKFMINGPWAFADIEKAGVNAGAIPIPSFDGSNPYTPLVGTKGVAINAYSTMQEEAQAFLEVIASAENAKLWHEMTSEVSPHTSVSYPSDSIHKVVFEAAKVGENMPNSPELKHVWEPMKNGLLQIASQQDVKSALDAAVDTIKTTISNMK